MIHILVVVSVKSEIGVPSAVLMENKHACMHACICIISVDNVCMDLHVCKGCMCDVCMHA